MSEWVVHKEATKTGGKAIDIWYVAPTPYKYGFASFTDAASAIAYAREANSPREKPSPEDVVNSGSKQIVKNVPRQAVLGLYLNRWIKLLEYCKQEDFDAKTFQTMHDEYAKAYQRLDFATQGEIAYLIDEWYKTENEKAYNPDAFWPKVKEDIAGEVT